ncbi:hypothetical protein [Streptomyces gardneri]|uniref:hypothetical protein n=1 Tax=Streptomyces gardneri TaxID=66892 RepID=UPI0037CFD246
MLAAHALHLARHAVKTNAADADVERALITALGAAVHHRDNGLFQQAHADIEFVRDAADRRWDREHLGAVRPITCGGRSRAAARMPYCRRVTGIGDAVITDDDVLTLLVERIPETKYLVEEKYELGQDEAPPTVDTELDLWANLIGLLTRPVLLPALEHAEPDSDLLRRCFGFVEDIYAGAGESRRGAIYFQILECLLEARPYLENAIPYLRGPVRERVSHMLKHYEVEGYEHGLPSL